MKNSYLRQWYLICTLTLLLFPTSISAAQDIISIQGKALSMEQIIKMIESKSSYTFFFKSDLVNNLKKQDINCEGTISEVLDNVLKGTGISYVLKEKEIILKNDKLSVPSTQQAKKESLPVR